MAKTRTSSIQLVSVVRCPECRHRSRVIMPIDACQFFWDCPHCRSVIRPKAEDCCVFCSYGTVPCPASGDGT